MINLIYFRDYDTDYMRSQEDIVNKFNEVIEIEPQDMHDEAYLKGVILALQWVLETRNNL